MACSITTIVLFFKICSFRKLLKDLSLINNATLFPHGILDYTPSSAKKSNKTFIVASYGFFLPHKGLLELIEAIDILKKDNISIKLKMVNAQYPIPESEKLIKEAKKLINSLNLQNNIILQTNFLSDNESLKELEEADLIIYPYQNTGESASGAVRYGIATGKIVAVSPIPIFDDVQQAVLKLPGTTPKQIAQGIKDIINEIKNNTNSIQTHKQNAKKWRDAHLYSTLSDRLSNILYSLNLYKQ